MIVDITNQILTDIKNKLQDITVLGSYQSNVSKFPLVTIEEFDNSAYLDSKDSGGFHHSNVSFVVEIYTNGQRKMSDAKKIRNDIDEVMSGEYGMVRGTPTIIPNYLDNSIYRYKMIYSGVIDKNKTIYRG